MVMQNDITVAFRPDEQLRIFSDQPISLHQFGDFYRDFSAPGGNCTKNVRQVGDFIGFNRFGGKLYD
jgi:hypothetical protein